MKFFDNPEYRHIIKESWAVSWPMLLIMAYEFLIGIADIYIAGFFGKEAQAAYGLAFQIYFIFITLSITLSVGIVSVVSRLFTSNKKPEFLAAVNTANLSSFLFGIIFTIIGFLFSENIVGFLKAPALIKPRAAELLRIYSIGFLFDYIIISTNSVLRSSGRAKKSMATMMIVCILNVALGFSLSFKTFLGYKGIALSKVISLAIGAVLNLVYMKEISGKSTGFSLKAFKEIMRISWPSGMVNILWQAGSMALFVILSKLPSHNIEIMAAFTNGLKIESAVYLPAAAFNMASAVVVGNFLGKNEKQKAFLGGLITAVIGTSIITIISIIIIVNARFILSFFSTYPIVIDESVRYLVIALLAEPLVVVGAVIGGALNGAGDTKYVMYGIGFSVWAIRIPLAYFLGIRLGWGAVSIWWVMNFSNLIYAVFIGIRYANKKWVKPYTSS